MMRYVALICGTAVLLALAGCGGNSDIKTPEEHQPSKLASIDTQLGVEYMKEGRDDVAMKKLQHAIDSDPDYAAAYDVLGLLYSKLGESEKAEASFKKALSLNPKNSGMLNNYGLFLCSHGKAEEGQKKFAAAIANPLYQTPDVAYTNAGICAMEQQKDLDAADRYFRKPCCKWPRLVSPPASTCRRGPICSVMKPWRSPRRKAFGWGCRWKNNLATRTGRPATHCRCEASSPTPIRPSNSTNWGIDLGQTADAT